MKGQKGNFILFQQNHSRLKLLFNENKSKFKVMQYYFTAFVIVQLHK